MKEEARQVVVDEKKEAVDEIVKFHIGDIPVKTTRDGRKFIEQLMHPPEKDQMIDYEMIKEDIEYKKFVENLRCEDVLELIYEISDKWKESDNPIESMKADLRMMIRTFKDNKFDSMVKYFRVDP